MDRTTYIGSSDARDILSGDWDRLYKRKLGLEAAPDFSDNFAVQLGLATEDFHLDWTIRKLNEEKGGGFLHSKAAEDGAQHWSAFKPDQAFTDMTLGSHPDALIRDTAGRVYPLEVKITARWKTADAAADFYMPQLQHHMLCWGTDVMLFSAICGTNDPERIWVGASKEWQEHYVSRCDAFWGHVEGEIPPAPVFFDQAKKAQPIVPIRLADSVPRNGWKKRSLDGDNRAPALIDTFLTTKDAVKSHESAKKELKALMRTDENELYGDRLTLKRAANGSIRFTVHDNKEAA